MQWRSPPESVQKVLVAPLIVLTSPVWLALIAVIAVDQALDRLFGPSLEWKPWFAWRPVRFNDWSAEYDDYYGRWAWLERVQRNRERGVVGYRPLRSASPESHTEGVA